MDADLELPFGGNPAVSGGKQHLILWEVLTYSKSALVLFRQQLLFGGFFVAVAVSIEVGLDQLRAVEDLEPLELASAEQGPLLFVELVGGQVVTMPRSLQSVRELDASSG